MRRLLFLVSVFMLLCGAVDKKPYDTLMAFFNSTNGPHWFNHSHWGETYNCAGWYGVECDNSTIQNLNLPSNGLSGPITDVFDLMNPSSAVNLSSNKLTGSISNLSFHNIAVDLSFNRLTGTLGGPFYQIVLLNNNNLTGDVPENVGQEIDVLDLSFNQFTSLSGISILTYWVNISHNKLAGNLSCFWGSDMELQSLDLSYNQLSGALDFNQCVPSISTNLIFSNNMLSQIIDAPDPGNPCDFSNNPFQCPIPLWAISRCGAKCT